MDDKGWCILYCNLKDDNVEGFTYVCNSNKKNGRGLSIIDNAISNYEG